MGREVGREGDRWGERDTGRDTGGERGAQVGKERDRQVDRCGEREAGRQVGRERQGERCGERGQTDLLQSVQLLQRQEEEVEACLAARSISDPGGLRRYKCRQCDCECVGRSCCWHARTYVHIGVDPD